MSTFWENHIGDKLRTEANPQLSKFGPNRKWAIHKNKENKTIRLVPEIISKEKNTSDTHLDI